jgi:hypothetical protein
LNYFALYTRAVVGAKSVRKETRIGKVQKSKQVYVTMISRLV